ncbi:type I-E CRISPR-associated protein Cse1/CasA [Streptomyces otsuchiensis]|uniref:type I-E CRISPR-associated protein Cse1/CasA n=1 Tax=Streptomyces otsuchiensis TaxID=2681388 RepID=UPI001030620E|nr:type I-E CRISPR-associated protein Cse1/CasA [Streptomyces otsuchiensis]
MNAPATATSAPPSFDLTDEPWLPVLRTDGTMDEVSLSGAFAQADTIRRLVGDLPTQEFALLRLLLAVLHDAVDGPQAREDWFALWEAPEPFALVPGYFAEHRDSFDLLHAERPFLQVAGLRTGKDEVASLNRLVADVPNGDAFFSMRRPGVARLTFGEAARWLVHAHAYDTSGIKSGMAGDKRVKGGRVYPLGVGSAGLLGAVYAEGDTLRETLLLNLLPLNEPEILGLPYPARHTDRPAWRRPPTGPGGGDKDDGTRQPDGLRDLYTWQARRVRLVRTGGAVTGVVLGYGDPLALLAPWKLEPMSGWRRSPAQEKKQKRPLVYMPRQLDPSRAAWRGLEAILPSRSEPPQAASDHEAPKTLPSGVVRWLRLLSVDGGLELAKGLLRLRTVGAVYGTQQSVIDEIVDDAVVMPLVLLDRDDHEHGSVAVDALKDADSCVRALGNLAANLARAVGSAAEGPTESARDLGYGALDGPYRAWLVRLAEADDADGTDDLEAARARWQFTVRRETERLARSLLNSAGPAASEGRWVSVPGLGERYVTDAQAEAWFRAALGKYLPLAPTAGGQPTTTDPTDPTDETDAPEATE